MPWLLGRLWWLRSIPGDRKAGRIETDNIGCGWYRELWLLWFFWLFWRFRLFRLGIIRGYRTAIPAHTC